MKKLVYSFTTGLLFLALLLPTGRLQAAAEYTKTIKKEFDITSDGTTSITNKYGKVEIKTWDQNRVKVDITIVVKSTSESKAQEVFDRISVDFSNGSNYVKAETKIEATKRSIWGWAYSSKSDYRINYEVFLPAGNSLELDHKYGDAYVAALLGKANISIKYGNLKAESFGRDANIYLGYSNGTIESVAGMKADVSYGKLICEAAEHVSLTTKYSKIVLGDAKDVRCESKYDSYELGEISSFNNTGKYDNIKIEKVSEVIIGARYSNLNIEELTNKLDLEMQYGGATIEALARSFSEVNLDGNYTGFKINVKSGADFHLDAQTNYAGIGYPSGMTVNYEQEKGKSHEVRGYMGSENTSSRITARLNYGGLKVRVE